MKWRWLLLLIVILLMAGCRSEEATSRFRSNIPGATFAPPGVRPTTLTVAELAQEPVAYGGELLQVSGAYQRVPVLVCDDVTRPSPVRWRLQEGDAQIGASGYDQLLRRLLPDGFEVTVTGRWVRWQGPVGCGKEASQQELWYLRVEEIVSPMPLARVTVTPGQVVALPTSASGSETPSIPTGTATGESTPTLTPTVGSPTSTPGQIPTATPRVTALPPPTPTESAAPTETPSTVPTTGAGTPSPTAVLSPTMTITGTVTVTATGQSTTTPTPTATEDASQVTVTNRGNLSFMNVAEFSELALKMDRIDAEEAHRWQFDVTAGEVITVSAIAMPTANIRLELQDTNGTVITAQDDEPAGSVETIAGVEMENRGTMRVVVHEASRAATYYALLLNKSGYSSDSTYTLAGLLRYNRGQTAALPTETDHIWVFPGEGGDEVSIVLSPQGSADLLFQVYGPMGNPLLSNLQNASGGGQSESLLNYTLADDGLYAIHVGEYDYDAANYSLTVSSQ